MHMRNLRGKRGQGMFEYILVLAMVLAAILATVVNLRASLQDGSTGYFDKMKTRIETAGDKFVIAAP